MRHLIFEEAAMYPVALLIKEGGFNRSALITNYIHPWNQQGIPSKDVIAFTLKYNDAGKAPVKLIKEYVSSLLPALDKLGTKFIYVADGNYFKVIAGVSKSEPHHGYCLPCKIKGYEHMQVVLGINHHALLYNPDLQSRLDRSLETLTMALKGQYSPPGEGIIHSAHYPDTLESIAAALNNLHQYPALTADIEAFDLAFDKAGIGSIGFAWNQHEGMAFLCDCKPLAVEEAGFYGENQPNKPVRALIKKFLSEYQGKLIWHNATYDLRSIIAALWMEDFLDTKGLLTGLDTLTASFDDTKIITYLATNSTAGNELGLKTQAHEFAGNYAQDEIKDIRKIPAKDLLQYNLVDCLSTWFVHSKHYPTMVADNQEDLYHTLFLPSLKVIIQMELSGLPMDQEAVAVARKHLETERDKALSVIRDSPIIKTLNLLLQQQAMEAKNAKLKVKQHPLSAFSNVTFNPNSGPQLQQLLYEAMGLPVIDLTDTKLPATGGDTLEKLINHTQNIEYRKIIQALIAHSKVEKILSAFIPSFENALLKTDGITYLHGGFNLGGTVSGRLSSSKPNLQQIPAGSTYGKLIKGCFKAPPGWLFCGADFNSLEDYISALTTKDPNKLKVYLEGYDGHCLRAFSYFPEKLPGIANTVESINSIKKKFPEIRQDSKGPTFALTYQGTWITLVRNLGFDEETAKRIEAGYHELYQVSDDYVASRLAQATQDGYVEVAFGLRVRTPLLGQTLLGTQRTPYEAQAEGRTAGNALGQSYGLLNNRAANAFMKKVWASPFREDIKPVALIHDSIYLLIKDNIDTVAWVNNELILAMQWQELPEIAHDTVKLGANLGIFWPSWANEITLPNQADKPTIRAIADKGKAEYGEKMQTVRTD